MSIAETAREHLSRVPLKKIARVAYTSLALGGVGLGLHQPPIARADTGVSMDKLQLKSVSSGMEAEIDCIQDQNPENLNRFFTHIVANLNGIKPEHYRLSFSTVGSEGNVPIRETDDLRMQQLPEGERFLEIPEHPFETELSADEPASHQAILYSQEVVEATVTELDADRNPIGVIDQFRISHSCDAASTQLGDSDELEPSEFGLQVQGAEANIKPDDVNQSYRLKINATGMEFSGQSVVSAIDTPENGRATEEDPGYNAQILSNKNNKEIKAVFENFAIPLNSEDRPFAFRMKRWQEINIREAFPHPGSIYFALRKVLASFIYRLLPSDTQELAA